VSDDELPNEHPGYPPLGPGAGPHNPFPDITGKDDVQRRAEDLQRRIVSPQCLFCGGTSFQEEIAKMPTRFGIEAHKSRLLICHTCGFMMNFSLGRGWTFD
jgi:hypothetical protein